MEQHNRYWVYVDVDGVKSNLGDVEGYASIEEARKSYLPLQRGKRKSRKTYVIVDQTGLKVSETYT